MFILSMTTMTRRTCCHAQDMEILDQIYETDPDLALELKSIFHSKSTVSNDEFDYFLLSIQWSGSVCKDLRKPNCKVQPGGSNFTIHGLWPNSDGNKQPANCRNVPFDYDKLRPLVPQMRRQWADYLGNEKGFWGHEWTKHGTCAMSRPGFETQNGYFSTTMDLHNRLPIMNALRSAGIVPSNTETYLTDEITGVLSRMFGAKMFMSCAHAENFGELRFCYSKDLRPMDCKTGNLRCGRRVQFLPVQY